MIFRPELADLVLAGRKTETRRIANENPRSPWWRERCRYEPGRSYAVQRGRTEPGVARIEVLGVVRQENLGDITPAGANAEGFDSVDAFMAYWRGLHGRWEPNLRVWVVRFKLVSDG